MNWRRAGMLLLLAALLHARARAQENYAVTAIKFTGNSSFLASTLLAQMKTRATPKWQSELLRKKPHEFSDETLREDVQRLRRFYQTEGFLRAQIEPPTLHLNTNRTMEITIAIVEGEPVLVRRLEYRCLGAVAADSAMAAALLAKLWPTLALQPHLRFRDLSAQSDADLIRQKLIAAGHLYVNVQPRLHVSPEENAVDVTFEVDAGPRCSFGEIRITGTKYTSRNLVRNQLLFKKGQVINQESIQKSQERLYGLGLFQVATIRPLLAQGKSEIVPVEVFVKEAPRLTMKFGVGFSLEAYEVLNDKGENFGFFDGLRFFVDLRRLGFLGGTRRLGLLAKYSALEPYNFSIEFAQAAFLFPMNTLILSPYTLKQIDPAYKLTKFGGDLVFRQQLALKTSSFIGYNLEQVDLLEEAVSAADFTGEEQANLYNKSSFSWGFVHDTSLPLFSPKTGSLYSAVFEYSVPPPDVFGLKLESFNFFKTLLENRHYLPVKRNMTFATRCRIGALLSFDEDQFIPVEERFFAGGSNSVRGWAYKQLGPLAEDGTPIGGNSLLEGSGELRYAIVNWLSGAMFLDFGNVSTVDLDYAVKKWHYSLGTGIRFETSFGPIRFDVARPVFGKENKPQFHFNFGQAF